MKMTPITPLPSNVHINNASPPTTSQPQQQQQQQPAASQPFIFLNTLPSQQPNVPNLNNLFVPQQQQQLTAQTSLSLLNNLPSVPSLPELQTLTNITNLESLQQIQAQLLLSLIQQSLFEQQQQPQISQQVHLSETPYQPTICPLPTNSFQGGFINTKSTQLRSQQHVPSPPPLPPLPGLAAMPPNIPKLPNTTSHGQQFTSPSPTDSTSTNNHSPFLIITLPPKIENNQEMKNKDVTSVKIKDDKCDISDIHVGSIPVLGKPEKVKYTDTDNKSVMKMESVHVQKCSDDVDMSNTKKVEPEYQCKICSKRFKYQSNLISHRRVHRADCPKCPHCGKKFARKSNLIQHIRIHTNERPYKCSYCPKAFKQKHSLTDHVRSHTGERPFSCEICFKSFAVKHNLIVHKRIHSGEKPYLCTICNTNYSSKSGINSHLKHRHPKIWATRKTKKIKKKL